MKKNNFLKFVKMTALVLFLGLCISYIVWAAGTTPPSSDDFGWVSGITPAPTNNGDDIIDVGTTDQVKDAGLSVNAFAVTQGLAVFYQDVKVDSLADPESSTYNRNICVDKEGNIIVC